MLEPFRFAVALITSLSLEAPMNTSPRHDNLALCIDTPYSKAERPTHTARCCVQTTGFQLTKRRDNVSAYRQFFGTDARIRLQWKDRLRLVWNRALADKKAYRR